MVCEGNECNQFANVRTSGVVAGGNLNTWGDLQFRMNRNGVINFDGLTYDLAEPIHIGNVIVPGKTGSGLSTVTKAVRIRFQITLPHYIDCRELDVFATSLLGVTSIVLPELDSLFIVDGSLGPITPAKLSVITSDTDCNTIEFDITYRNYTADPISLPQCLTQISFSGRLARIKSQCNCNESFADCLSIPIRFIFRSFTGPSELPALVDFVNDLQDRTQADEPADVPADVPAEVPAEVPADVQADVPVPV
jgi:hypothetical protein